MTPLCPTIRLTSTITLQVQHQLTSAILRAGERTHYGRDHGLARMRTLATFRSQHPVTQYSHYAAYVEAVERGDEMAMLGDDEVFFFAASSGTTGANKHLPVGRKQMERIMQNCTVVAAICEGVYGCGTIARALVITTRAKHTLTSSGKLIGSMSPILHHRSPLIRLRGVTPSCVDEVETETAACYVGLLFALRDEDMYAVFSGFIYVFLRLINVLESQWQRLVSEIAAGRIGDHLPLPGPLLARINAHLTPAPDRAKALGQMFSEGFDNIVPRVWPKLRFLQASRSGLGSDMYMKLAGRYMGDVPVLDLAYCCSETWLGESYDPAAVEAAFTLNADSCLYEFLPVTPDGEKPQASHYEHNGMGSATEAKSGRVRRRGEATSAARDHSHAELKHGLECEFKGTTNTEKPKPGRQEGDMEDVKSRLLLADELRVGHEYELVVTTRSGLYRYRQGDVVRVREFHNQAPVVQLLYRWV